MSAQYPILVDMDVADSTVQLNMDVAEQINAEVIQGTDVSDTTAVEADVVSGKKFHKANGDLATGTLVLPPSPVSEDAIYSFRALPYTSYLKKLSKIVGGTVAWNQLVKEMNSTNFVADLSSTTVSISNGIAEVLPSSQYGGIQASSYNRPTIIDGHKYFGTASVMSQNGLSVFITVNTVVGERVNASNNWSEIYVIANGDTTKNNTIRIRTNNTSNFTTFYVKNVTVFDLTAMFGSTIADYIYALEQANSGAGVAWFRNLFPKDYYPFDAGSIVSVKTSAHKMVGFNQWDEEWELGGLVNATGATYSANDRIRSKNFCRCVPSTVYYCKAPSVYTTIWWYDASKGFIKWESAQDATNQKTVTSPSDAAYFKLVIAGNTTTYGNNLCLNISRDGERNGEYEPYVECEYVLDGTIELRGLLKLDANNNLYYDGDEYTPNGNIKRNYGTRAYQSGDESDSSVLTDGTNTIYKLSTPTTETATPYIETQATFPNGTEEFADGRTVEMPVEAVAEYSISA